MAGVLEILDESWRPMTVLPPGRTPRDVYRLMTAMIVPPLSETGSKRRE
jgi:hypothetical protein